MMSNSKRSLHLKLRYSERGVFVPLLAVVLLGLIYVAVALGFDAQMVKRSQMDLRMKMDMICSLVGRTPATYVENAATVQRFIKRMVDDRHIKFGTLEAVRFITPTMPSETLAAPVDFSFYGIGAPPPPPYRTGPTTFSALGIPSCTLGSAGTGDCEYYGTTNAPPLPAPYPSNIFNNVQSAGNSVACEAEARVHTFLLGRISFGAAAAAANRIRVRSVFWSPVRGPNLLIEGGAATFYPGGPPATQSTAIRTSPGLTIGIGTEMFTSSWDARFRFSLDGTSDWPVTGTALEDYDPIQKFANTTSFDAFETQQPAIPAPAGTGTFATVAAPSDTTYMGAAIGRSAASPIDPDYSITDNTQATDFVGGSSLIPSDREALLVSCLNPAVLVRNIFLSTIVELAARHGQLRNMTEILHINPIHRDTAFIPGGVEGNTTVSNSPTKITSFGQDIAQRRYQIPYIFYHTGLPGSEWPDPWTVGTFGWPRPGVPSANRGLDLAKYNKNGWLNPYTAVTSAGVTNVAPWVNHHALIAQQLRHCFHLYGGDPTYFSRYQEYMYRAGIGLFDGQFFEPDTIAMQDPPRTLYVPQYTGGVQRWDQDPANPAQNLTAGELMAVLGTTQMCPYTENDSLKFPGFTNGGTDIQTQNEEIRLRFGLDVHPCPLTSLGGGTSPPDGGPIASLAAGGNLSEGNFFGLESLELRPDLLGFIRYVQGAGSLRATSGNPTVLAINSPGLFPIENPASTTQPFNAIRYTPPANIMSHILLVFHEQISTTERDAILAEVRNMRTTNPQMTRPITVVYFPTTMRDSAAIQRIYDAFDAPTVATTDPMAQDNTVDTVVYNISPYDDTFGDGINPTTLAPNRCRPNPLPTNWNTRPEYQKFRDYWQCMLTHETDNVVRLARDIFYNRILRSEMKY